MRVKAFSLIEIIVVIILIGIMFSLVLTVYTSKKNKNIGLTLKDIPLHVKKNGTLYIYGKDCQKAIIELKDGQYTSSTNFKHEKENEVIEKNALDRFEQFDFGTHRIKDKNEEICFKLAFKKKRFFQKFIVSTQSKYYLFSPFYQEVKEFDSLDDAKVAFESEKLYPQNRDDYLHE